MSDSHGKQFSLSLKDIIGSKKYAQPDIEEINSLEGVLIANVESDGPPRQKIEETRKVHEGNVINKGKTKSTTISESDN